MKFRRTIISPVNPVHITACSSLSIHQQENEKENVSINDTSTDSLTPTEKKTSCSQLQSVDSTVENPQLSASVNEYPDESTGQFINKFNSQKL